MIRLELVDEEYPNKGFNHTRAIARVVILDEEGNVAIHRLYRDDAFCKQEYYETPGGGVDEGESLQEAAIREAEEETGYRVEIIEQVAEIKDAYNLIGRRNENHYFLAKRKEYVGRHFASKGDTYIQETKWVKLEDAINMMESQDDNLVSGLVKRRELPVLRHCLQQIGSK